MPLVRFEVRNEFGLADPDLYRAPAKKEDPKALLEGVAVAGLVGILRQLGDLAEFAADIFHDLHEQVTATAARGHKVMARVQHIEAALPLVEKAVRAQKSHIHFAYTVGCDWHANVHSDHDHLLSSDLPRFIMDSYEECRDPPRFFLLDKFDSAGAGACLKRYSDPSYFKMVWATSELIKAEKVQSEKKTRKYMVLEKGSKQRGEVQHVTSLSQQAGSSMQFTSLGTDEPSFAAETIHTFDKRFKSEVEYARRSKSLDSRTRFSYIEPAWGVNSPKEPEYNFASTSKIRIDDSDSPVSVIRDIQNLEVTDDSQPNSLQGRCTPRSPSVSWDEKTEIGKPTSPQFHEEPTRQQCQEPTSPQLREEPTSPQLCEEPVGPQFLENPVSPQVRDSILGNKVQDSESLPSISEQSRIECETTKPGEDILFDIEKLPSSFPASHQFDEVASETDNYVDALNTLESETETDSEFQTKRELQPPSNFSCQGITSETVHIKEMTAPDSDSDSSNVETPIACHIPMDKETFQSFSTSVSSGCVASPQSLHKTDFVPNQGSADDNNLCGSYEPDATSFELVNGCLSSGSDANLHTKLDNETTNLAKPQESPPSSISDRPSIIFWTNGGLLGVEPSKPPVFSGQDILHENSISGTNVLDANFSRHTWVKPNDNTSENSCSVGQRDGSTDIFESGHQFSSCPSVPLGRADYLVQRTDPSECSALCQDNGSMKSSQEPVCVPALPGTELDRFEDSDSVNISCQTDKHNLRERNIVGPLKSPISLDIEAPPIECSQDTGISSSLSGLTHTFFANGFQMKASRTGDKTSIQSNEVNTDLTKSQERILSDDEEKRPSVVSSTSNEPNPDKKLELVSSENSISSQSRYSEHPSPPLKHMKISFHPINSLDTCKLKLEFPDSHLHESIEELTFPSFQLLPGPSVPMQYVNSESDDDTFSRSCPYSSEDFLSHCSESNSEIWEHDEQSGSENREIYDDSRRVSSSGASTSSTLETEGMGHHIIPPTTKLGNLEGENSMPSFQPASLLDIPSLDSLKSSIRQHGEKCNFGPGDPQDSILQHPIKMPQPPPLPPLQWRKPSFASVEHKQLNGSEVIHNFDGILSAGFQHLEQDIPKLPGIGEVTAHPIKSTHDVRNLNRFGELNPSACGKELDEREVLLHQIQKKSFSLRRTVTSRPSLIPRPTTNANVAAILEKANAIRQAFVGSDDGGDDENWSDG